MTISTAHAKREIGPGPNFGSLATTVGAVAVGAVLVEAALIPGIALGAAAILAPELATRHMPALWRGLQSLVRSPAVRVRTKASPRPVAPPKRVSAVLPRLRIGQSLGKTITFRITVASLDFAWSYIFLGEFATAAGLSALNLTAGPIFYFLHEAAWNVYGSPDRPASGSPLVSIAILPSDQPGTTAPVVQVRGLKVTRALAKTVVYETFGTIAEFTVNLVVIGDVVTAAIITAPFAIFGPFIYLGHERAWDYFSERAKQAVPPARSPASGDAGCTAD